MKKGKSICCKSTHMPGCQAFFIQTFLEKRFYIQQPTRYCLLSFFNIQQSSFCSHCSKESSTNHQLANLMSFSPVLQLPFSSPSKNIRQKLYFHVPVTLHSPGLPFSHPLIFICKHHIYWGCYYIPDLSVSKSSP